jgi:hypothetical protein
MEIEAKAFYWPQKFLEESAHFIVIRAKSVMSALGQ